MSRGSFVKITGTGILLAVFAILSVGNHAEAIESTPPLPTNELHPRIIFAVDGTARSVVEAFEQAKLPYYPEDRISVFPEPSLGLGSVITVDRALKTSVQDGKRKYELRGWETTVGDLLAAKNIDLADEDRVAPSLSTNLAPNMKITITRVARTNVTEKEVIAYQTVVEKDYSQFVGEQKVIQAGQNGQREKTYLLIREDGELVSKTLIASKVAVAPVTAKVKQGGLNPVLPKCLPLKDWVVDASLKNKIDPNALFYRIQKESTCNPNSQASAGYQGLLQYDPSLWPTLAARAGFAGASVWDARAQIYVTAWAWANGHRSRWPIP